MEQNDDIDLFSFERVQDELFEPEYEPIYNKDGVEVEKGRKDPYGVIYSLDGKRLIKSTNEEIRRYKIRKGVERICDMAFCGTLIGPITIPEDVISIGNHAFHGCIGLTEITFSENLAYIGDYAFCHCHELRHITLPAKLSRIGHGAFGRIYGSITIDSRNPIPPICDLSAFMDASLSRSLLIVPPGTKEAYLKASVWRSFRYIVERYEDTEDIYEEISLSREPAEDRLRWESNVNDDGVIYNSDGRRLLKCENNDMKTYSVKPGTEAICVCAFSRRLNVAEIVLPDSMRIIGASAFYYSGVSKVTFGNRVETIGDWAFDGCHLSEITISRSVKYLGDFAFSDCKKLTDVFIEGEVSIIGCGTFEGCVSLKHVLIPRSVTVVESRAWNGCSKMETFVSLNPIPPACEEGAFEKVPVETCVVYVPKGAKEAYSKVSGWKDFKNIVEIDEALVFQKLR